MDFQTLGRLNSLADFIIRSKALKSPIYDDRADLVSLEIEAEVDGNQFLSCFSNAIRQTIAEYPGAVIACSSLTPTEPSSLTETGLLSSCLVQILKQRPKLYQQMSRSSERIINAVHNLNFELRVRGLWECLRLAFLRSDSPCFWIIHTKGTPAEKTLLLKIIKQLQFFCKLDEGSRKVIIVTSSMSRIGLPPSKIHSQIFLDRDILRESIEKDLQQQLDLIITTKPRISDIKEKISQLLNEHGSNHKLMDFLLDALRFIHIPIPGALARLADDFTSTAMAFRVIFDQVPHSCQTWARKVLGFLCFSMRPMSIGELATAVAVTDCKSLEQLQKSIAPGTAAYIRELLPGIVRIHSGKVYVVHDELKSFLRRNPNDWYYLEDYHSEIALACYHYLCLLIERFGISDKSPLKAIVQWERRARSYPGNIRDALLDDRIFWLSSYASMYWCEHCLSPQSDAAASPRPGPWITNPNRLQELLTLRFYSRWPFDQICKIPQERMPPDLRKAVNMSEMDAFEMTLQLVDSRPSKACLDLIHFPTSPAEDAVGRWVYANFTKLDMHGSVALYPQVIEALLQHQKEATLDDISCLLMSIVLHNNSSFLVDLLGKLEDQVNLREVSCEALSYAISWGFVDIVKILLDYQATPLGTFRIGSDITTLLDTAVLTGNEEMVQVLLDAGADVNARAKTGFLDRNNSPLHVACQLGLIDMVRLLLDAGADVNLPIANGITALHTASMRGFASICKLLIKHGAFIATDAQHQTPLYTTVRWYYIGQRYKKTAATLLEALQNQFPGYREDSSDDAENLSKIINAQADSRKRTALMYAAMTGDMDLVISMINIGASIHITDENDIDPLFRATIVDDIDMVRYLLDNGAQLDRIRDDGSLLLHDACDYNSQEVIEELLKRNTPVDHLDNDLIPPLGYAAMQGLICVVKQLIPRSSKETISLALISAARYGYHEIVNTLLDAGANINHQDEFGDTPLHVSCWNYYPRVTRILLARMPDINRTDNYNCAAIENVAWRGASECLKLLLDAGADLEIVSGSGRTPLFQAAEADIECFKILLEHGAQAVLPESIKIPPQYPVFKAGVSFLAGLAHECSPNIIRAYVEHLKLQVSEDAFLLEINEALVAATYVSKLENIQILLEFGADPNFMISKFDVAYGSAIGMAVINDNLEIVRELLDNMITPVDLNKVDDYRTTPLQLAMDWGLPSIREKMLDLLLTHGADPTISSGTYGTVLNATCVVEDDEIFNKIVNLPGVSRDVADDLGRLPLHLAARRCPTDTRIDLLTTESSTFRSTDKQGRNALHHAAAGGRYITIEKILKECPDLINAPDRDGWTPLHWTCRQDNIQATRSLINYGANKEAKTHDRWAPRHVAIYHGKTEHLDFFPEDGGDADDEELPSEAAERVNDDLCDSCFCDIYGTGYRCGTCPKYWLCFKCYWIYEETHPRLHVFSRHDQDSHEIDTPPGDNPEAGNGQDGESSSSMTCVDLGSYDG
ncbi:ankyrin repeat-containing domain protein [Daldinia loculata]|uniref:ankyrin repeat-containing domain protein n=1 Tax=Daldinia loculata TaxID=103429 RepID=UPI0020C1FEF8|nr:ankyrin repeat-containing domain protein [Daldinia loculata]KAI1645468.1 ankyrin repeat-containing domain protein [Daldinia loculata]